MVAVHTKPFWDLGLLRVGDIVLFSLISKQWETSVIQLRYWSQTLEYTVMTLVPAGGAYVECMDASCSAMDLTDRPYHK